MMTPSQAEMLLHTISAKHKRFQHTAILTSAHGHYLAYFDPIDVSISTIIQWFRDAGVEVGRCGFFLSQCEIEFWGEE